MPDMGPMMAKNSTSIGTDPIRPEVFHAFMIGGRADPDLRAGGARMATYAAGYFASHLSRRFDCSQEAAGTAHQIMFAQAVLMIVFSEEETDAAAADTEEHRRHLVRALRAVLRTPE